MHLDLRSNTGRQGVQIAAPQVPDAQLDHPRERRREDDAGGEIGILGNDDECVPPRVLPDLAIGRTATKN